MTVLSLALLLVSGACKGTSAAEVAALAQAAPSPPSGEVMARIQALWRTDRAAAVLYARIHREALPADLLQRVQQSEVEARRQMEIQRAQSERLREQREMDDAINTQMVILGGSWQSTPSSSTPFAPGADPEALRRQMFEGMIALALVDVPATTPAQRTAAEQCLTRQVDGTMFLRTVLAPEQVMQFEQQIQQMRMANELMAALGVQGQELAALQSLLGEVSATVEELPRILAVSYVPTERLAIVAEQLGIEAQ
jgi:hypothetical protein